MTWKDMFTLSFRNLTSQKSRSFLTIGGVGIGIMAVIFLVSIGYGVQELAIRDTIQSKSLAFFDVSVGTGDIQQIDSSVTNKIQSINYVKSTYPQLETPIKFGLKPDEIGTEQIAFINDQAFVGQSDLSLFSGRMFKDDQKELLISTATLNQLGLDQGTAIDKKLYVLPQLKSGFALSGDTTKITPIEFTIVGIIDDTNNPYISLPVTPIKDAIGEFSFSALKVEVESKDKVLDVRKEVSDLGLNTEYIGDIVSQLEDIFRIAQYILGALGLVATFVAALGMFNTLSVSLLERTREIGIMKTLGTRKRDVRRLFLIEGMLISVLGGLTGIVLGILFGKGLNLAVNILAKATGNAAVNFYYVPINFILMILGLVIILGFFVGMFPAKRATTISPLQALRYE